MLSKKRKNIHSPAIFDELAARNVKKSAKNYYIYFFTLMFSVCLFYSFNSVSTQFSSLGLDDRLNYLSFSSSILTAFSVIVCIIMGALVVYANRFLLKRRKKEMGIYATLGMDRKNLNNLLMKETLRIGVVSLIVGIVLGVFGAQILSLITAKLAGLSLSSYRFMISGKAIVLSVIFFGILFVFVHFFNIRELKKMSLLEMLYAERKNESVPGEKKVIDVLVLILSIMFILGGYAYIFFMSGKEVIRALGVGGLLLIVGTVLFFLSVLSVKAKLMRWNKFSYFRGLNMFTASQLQSRLKTEGLSGAMISILLFLSLSLTILGPGMGKYVMNGFENAAPYDGTIYYAYDEFEELQPRLTKQDNPIVLLQSAGVDINRLSGAYESTWLYEDPNVTSEFLKELKKEEMEFDIPDTLTIMGVEDYNRMLVLQGKDPIVLGDSEFAVSYAFPPMKKAVEDFAKNPKTLKLGGKELHLAEKGIYNYTLKVSNILQDGGIVVVSQPVADTLNVKGWEMNFKFSGNTKEANEKLYNEWLGMQDTRFLLMAAQEARVSITADNLLTTYLGIYLGITFLITSGAVLALQQLTQSTDNVKRYSLLKKLGASKRDMKRSLSKQIRVHFGLPMVLAVVNAAMVVWLVFRYFEGLSLAASVAIIGSGTLLVFVVYLLYFITTYVGSRRIIEL